VRVLVVLRGPIRTETVKARWQAVSRDRHELAFCYVLPPDNDGLAESVRAQRAVTLALRRIGEAAVESVAVFAASERDGERVDDCARAWGATEVWDQDKPNRPALP
jgi:hypothetical protein